MKISSIKTVILSGLLSAELCLTADILMALKDQPVKVQVMFPIFLVLFILILIATPYAKKLWFVCCIALTSVLLLLIAVVAVVWYSFYKNAVYLEPDDSRTASNGSFFQNRNVMLIVPHQDDELNLLGGALQEYTAGGSQVTVVFTTNGDYLNIGQERIREAITVLATYGIPEKDIIFLGYGDDWEGDHIYNSPEDEIKTSHVGYTKTYGTSEHPAYHNGISYTLNHFMEDLQSVIEEVQPEVIYCVDNDSHVDHRATSMIFEKVFGKIRQEKPDYTPLIFKAFAYSNSYFSYEDFYNVNMISTLKNGFGDYASVANIYRWENRIRIPVEGKSLSRSLLNADLYQKTRLYKSQSARDQATRMINGDKVFWQRDCSGVSYSAEVTATSGQAWRLNDFMLLDSTNVRSEYQLFDGTWIPDEMDTEKQAVMTFADPVTVDRIVLYDNPSFENNVLDAELTLYTVNGEKEAVTIRTGPLKSGGEGTEVAFNPIKIQKIEVRLLETEGEFAGLTELEAYTERQNYDYKIMKICDSEGNFIYDYIYGEKDTESFTLYTLNCSTDIDNYEVSCIGEGCTADSDENGIIQVCVPKGKQCVLTVCSTDGSVSDSVILRNRGLLLMKLGQSIESFFCNNYPKLMNTAIYTIVIRQFYHLFR